MRDGSTRGKGKTPVIAAVLLLILAALMVTAGLFLADPGFDGSKPEPVDDDAVLTAAGCVLSGEGFSLTEGQVCGLLAAQLEETPVSWLDPQSLRVRADGEQRLTVYAPVSWNGLTLHVTAEFLLTADASEKRLTAELTGAAVGRMPVPPQWLADRAAGELPDGVSIVGTRLSFPAELPLVLLGGDKTLAALEVTRAEVSESGMTLFLTVNADGTADLLQEGMDWLGGLLGLS